MHTDTTDPTLPRTIKLTPVTPMLIDWLRRLYRASSTRRQAIQILRAGWPTVNRRQALQILTGQAELQEVITAKDVQ